jgi:prepilin-type N-terminal cleavage/methylation domain-containing protein
MSILNAIVKKPGAKGFTLVEMMVVIAIIAVLAAIAIPVFTRTRENARQTRCLANLHSIGIALKNYMVDWNGYPLPYDAITGTGGVTQLYLEGYITSTRVLRCPDDATNLTQYIAANAINTTINTPTYPGTQWAGAAGEELFADRYSSYNQLLLANVAYPLYNYYGYRGYNGFAGVTASVPGGSTYPIAATAGGTSLSGTGPSGYILDQTASATSEIGSLYGDGTGPPDGALGGQIWSGAIYTDANHLYKYNDGSGIRIFDRTYNSYARPLWDVPSNTPTAFFPGLVNRNAPDNTIVTHCPYHRNWFGNTAAVQQDLIVRLSGDTEKLRLGGYDWVVQKQTAND